MCLVGPACRMAHTVTSFLKRGKSDGANHLSEVRQAHGPSGVPGLGHHRGNMFLSAGAARPSRGKKPNHLRKLRKCVAILSEKENPSIPRLTPSDVTHAIAKIGLSER